MSCALCVVTIAGGLLIAQQLGISDFVFTLWVSGFNTALAYYLSTKIKVGIINNKYILSALLFLLAYFYFLKTGQMSGEILNGMIVGMILFIISHNIESFLYTKNKRRSLIPFQKAIIPLLFFGIITLLAAVKAF